jgi:hypothetical protein
VLLVLALGCGDDASTSTEADADAGSSGSEPSFAPSRLSHGDRESGKDAASDAGAAEPIDTTPRKIVSGTASITGVTSDGYVLYRAASGLAVIGTDANATPTNITAASAIVTIRGKVAFVFRNVDYTTNLADLDVWTAAGGVKNVGQVMFGEDAIAANEDGTSILYATNVTPTTAVLVVAKSDLSTKTTLLPAMGRSSITTCRFKYAFAGTRVLAAACEVGSLEGTLRGFDPVVAGTGAGTWSATAIASKVQPTFAADSEGKRVFYITTGSQGRVAENGATTLVDNAVTGGILLPDGSAALYTVGDQLRRSPLPAANPSPIVTVGYVSRAGFSPDFSHVLYSSVVTYVGTERRDLRIASTSSLNTTVDKLAETAEAQISLSPFTADGDYALWLTNVGVVGAATLNARKVTGGAPHTFPNVVAVSASKGSRIVFTDKRSDPLVYPILADIEVVNLSMPDPTPITLQTKVLDSGNFALLADGTAIVYARSGAATDAGAAGDAIYVQALP